MNSTPCSPLSLQQTVLVSSKSWVMALHGLHSPSSKYPYSSLRQRTENPKPFGTRHLWRDPLQHLLLMGQDCQAWGQSQEGSFYAGPARNLLKY